MPSLTIETRHGRHGDRYRAVVERWVAGKRRRQHGSWCPWKRMAGDQGKQMLGEAYDHKLGLKRPQESRTWEIFSKEYLEHCRAHKRAGTVDHFDAPALASFKAEAGDRTLRELEPKHVERWMQKLLADDYSKTTVRMWFRALRAAMNYAVRMRYLSESPTEGLRAPEPDGDTGRALTDAEIAELLDGAPESLRRTAAFALNTGLRIGEVLGLDWAQIRRPGWVAEIPSSARKSRKPCRVPLNASARLAMGTPRESGRVFPYSEDSIRWSLRQSRERAERARAQRKAPPLGRVRFHDFRHTFCTRFMASGGSPLEILAMGLHRSLDSLKCYSHPTDDTLADRVSRVSYSPPKSPPKPKPPTPGGGRRLADSP